MDDAWNDITLSPKRAGGRHKTKNVMVEGYPMVAEMGVYDVRWDFNMQSYMVVCPQNMANMGTTNYTDYVMRDGILEPMDNDVPLDPYHLGLLYRIHAEVGAALLKERDAIMRSA